MTGKVLLANLAALILASSCRAQAPPVGYIALYVDESRTSFCVEALSPYTQLDMYVFCLPSLDGQMCAEFAISYPDDPGVIKSSVTENSHVASATGSIDQGMRVCFTECQTDWNWPVRHLIFLNTSERSSIDVTVSGETGFCRFASCLDGFPDDPCLVFNRLYINYSDEVDPQCGSLSAGQASWGAIKSLF